MTKIHYFLKAQLGLEYKCFHCQVRYGVYILEHNCHNKSDLNKFHKKLDIECIESTLIHVSKSGNLMLDSCCIQLLDLSILYILRYLHSSIIQLSLGTNLKGMMRNRHSLFSSFRKYLLSKQSKQSIHIYSWF